MGVNMGLLPTKGLTLPFISYGGNSILVGCISVALLTRVVSETELTRQVLARKSVAKRGKS
jgi:cell division protein FtsW